MSGSITASPSTSTGSTAGTSSTSTAASTAASTGQDALSSLTGNFDDFLQLLMTQLQNQDPTSPMDTNAFTTELAQFTGVEQQIATNTNLTQLIQLTQASDVLGSSSVLGKQVQVTSSQMPLQNGTGEVTFTAPSAGPVDISVYNAAGAKVEEQLVQATSGSNTWNWDGTGTTGAQEPDGAYTVVVTAENADGSTTPLSFTVGGTVTGVEQNSSQLDLDLGALQTSFGNVQSVGN